MMNDVRFRDSIECDMLCGAICGGVFFLALKVVLSFVS
jgi:hypothetical protein